MNENNNKSVEAHLENNFEQLEIVHEAPPEIKDAVFNTLQVMTIFGEVADLFVGKFGKTQAQFLGLGSENAELEEKDR